jgi:hypothetical protein
MAQDGVEARELKRLRAGIPSGTVRSLCHWSSARTRGFHPFTRRLTCQNQQSRALLPRRISEAVARA